MEIVLWGCGKNAQKILSQLNGIVTAIIDSNVNKHGNLLNGIRVISFYEYLEKYRDLLILITVIDPVASKAIEQKIKSSGVEHYITYNDGFPNEIVGLNSKYFQEKYFELYANFLLEEKYVVFGITAYSLFFSNYLYNVKKKKVKFVILNEKFKECTSFKSCIINKNDIYDYDTILFFEKDYKVIIKNFINNRIIDMYNLSGKVCFYNNDIKKYHNRYTGKRCFLVATGPSLKIKDLEIINKNNEYSFGVNTSYKVFLKSNWRPNFFVVTDRICQKIYGDEILREKSIDYFFTDCNLEFMHNHKDNNLNYIHAVYDKSDGLIRFSEDISKQVYNNAEGGTVIYSCLQIAVYMGFSEIYILGADCDYSTSKKHFIENYYHENDDGDKRKFNYEGVFKEYQSAKWYADCHDVKIYNATRGGKLEIFDRVDFDSLFE